MSQLILSKRKKGALRARPRNALMGTGIPGIFYQPTPSVPHLVPALEGFWGQAQRCDPIINKGVANKARIAW